MPTITMMTLVTQGDSQIATELDNTIVMMSVEQGKYYGLDSVGSRIWNLLEQPHRIMEVCAVIQDEFAVERETCEQDVLDFVSHLVAVHLLKVIDEGVA
ncbi:MAG: lasso peptide biosynthesis PqqD family chaperone [Candidatus Competibacteraceae bacterium]